MKTRSDGPASPGHNQKKVPFWIGLAATVALAGLGTVVLYAENANSYYKRGQAAEAREDYDAAFENYQKAYTMSPKDETFRVAYYRVRLTDAAMHVSKARNMEATGDDQGALVELLRASEIDPSDEAAQQEVARIRTRHGAASPATETSVPQTSGSQAELDSIGGPAQLRPVSNDSFTFHMVADSKEVYQAVGKAAGINILFDPDYISKRIQVDLVNVTLLDALRIVSTMSGTFWHPITQNTILVAQNTRSRRAELDEQAVQTFYLTNAWQQNDLNDVQTALRNVLPNAKVYGVASQNAIVMRGTPDELLLAQKLVNDLDKSRPEVVVDIAVLEVSKNWERTLGIQWPSSVGVALQAPTSSTSSTGTGTCTTGSTDCTTGTTSAPTLYNLAHLNASDFAVTVGSATANLLLNDNHTRILQNPRIRAADQQKATMKIGSRIPIATGSYQTGAATALVSSLVNTQFTYQDVGVNIEVTPTVHYDRDVTLKVKIEVTAQSGSVTISGVTEPIISQRVAEQVIRLREGEANILGGIQEKQIQENWSGIPGLSSIPVLRYLFGSKDHTIQDDEIVFLVVPHIVRSEDLSPSNLRTIDTGPGMSIELRHVVAPVNAPAVAPTPAPARPQAAHPTTGALPGPTAAAAGPAALEQMRAAAEPTVPPADASPPGVAAQAEVPAQHANLTLNSPGPVVAGTTFQVPVVLTGATDVTSVPMEIQYDASKLSLVNVGDGDLLNRDGQIVSMAHRDDGPGSITMNVSRSPGASGVSGAGVVCVLSFQAKAAGSSTISFTRAGGMNSAGKPLEVQGLPATITVQ